MITVDVQSMNPTNGSKIALIANSGLKSPVGLFLEPVKGDD